MIPLTAFALAGCLAVSAGSDRILAGDLAPAFPVFAAVAPDTEVGLAPAPGVARVFAPPELQRLALRLRLPAAPETEICVERPVAAPDPAKLLAAMRKELPEARIEILDYSRHPEPEGEIEFPLRGLQAGAGGAMWMGCVHYGSNRRFTIWARVKALVTVERVLAAGDLRSGQAIAAAQVVAQSRDEFPAAGPYAKSLDEVVGKWLRIPIRAGSAIRMDQLELPKDVVRGETVQVEVRNGGVHMEVEAQAEGSGALHETIPMLNTTSKRRFLARVEGKGRVSVDASAAKVLQ
jgi:flagella basal body P-ring formation protein FlgA